MAETLANVSTLSGSDDCVREVSFFHSPAQWEKWDDWVHAGAPYTSLRMRKMSRPFKFAWSSRIGPYGYTSLITGGVRNGSNAAEKELMGYLS